MTGKYLKEKTVNNHMNDTLRLHHFSYYNKLHTVDCKFNPRPKQDRNEKQEKERDRK